MKKETMVNILRNATRNGLTPGALAGLEKMLEDLEAEVAAADMRKACGVNAVNIEKAAKNIIKNSIKSSYSRPDFNGAWIHNGKQYVSDGFRLLQITSPLDLPKAEKEMEEPTRKNFEKMFSDIERNTDIFQLPTAADLKKMIAARKAEAKEKKIKIKAIGYFTGGPVINAELLLDVITATGSAEFRTVHPADAKKWVSPCFLLSESCNALVLPVNVPADKYTAGTCAIVA